MKILNLEKRIMWRVYVLYTIRKLKNPFVPELVILCGLYLTLSFLVSVPSVFANVLLTHGSPSFLAQAFWQTGVIVKLLSISVLISGVFFFRDLGLYTTNLVRTRLA